MILKSVDRLLGRCPGWLNFGPIKQQGVACSTELIHAGLGGTGMLLPNICLTVVLGEHVCLMLLKCGTRDKNTGIQQNKVGCRGLKICAPSHQETCPDPPSSSMQGSVEQTCSCKISVSCFLWRTCFFHVVVMLYQRQTHGNTTRNIGLPWLEKLRPVASGSISCSTEQVHAGNGGTCKVSCPSCLEILLSTGLEMK